MGHSLWCNMPGNRVTASARLCVCVCVLLDGRVMSHGVNLLVFVEYVDVK